MMTLGEMKELFSSYPKDAVLGYGFGDVFSWRGAYDEPCFSIAEDVTVGECLVYVESALTLVFYGYKGGEYIYSEASPVNFECEDGAYTNGKYLQSKLFDIAQSDDTTVEIWKKLVDGGPWSSSNGALDGTDQAIEVKGKFVEHNQ